MKKKILLFLLFFIPFMINAEEKCTIISGNGKDIGSEIECAGEHFYIIEDKEDSVRMLAKYNLEIGDDIKRVIVTEERYNEIKTKCGAYSNFCDAVLEEPEFIGYTNSRVMYEVTQDDVNYYVYLLYKEINPDVIKQSSKAIGAHGDETGNPEPYEYGVISDFSRSIDDSKISEIYGNGKFMDLPVQPIFYSINWKEYSMDGYTEYLIDNGIDIIEYDILSVTDISNIVYKITNKSMPLDEWGNEDNWGRIQGPWDHVIYIIGSIKEQLPDEYKWLYSTTYWTRTAYVQYNSSGDVRNNYDEYMYFVDTLGNLCNGYACDTATAAGIRPVVEISKDSINYNLTTKSDNGGTLETGKNHVEGDTIVLNANPETGYKLEKLIVTTDSGTTIEISGKDIVENDDGTISINPDVFKMPLENVVVEAKWAFVNPKTGVSSFIGVMFTLMLIGISSFFMIRNCNNSYEL